MDLGLQGTKARTLGQDKMRYQSTALVADFSPLGDLAPRTVHGIHAVAAALSVASLVDIEINARHQLAEYARSIETPDEFRDVLAYTSPATV